MLNAVGAMQIKGPCMIRATGGLILANPLAGKDFENLG